MRSKKMNIMFQYFKLVCCYLYHIVATFSLITVAVLMKKMHSDTHKTWPKLMPFSNSHLFNCYIHFNITALFVALADCISLNLISRLPWSVLNKFVDINCFTKSKLKTNIHSLEDSEIQIYIHEPHFQNLTSESTSINTFQDKNIVGPFFT